jgi:hypothetical protein
MPGPKITDPTMGFRGIAPWANPHCRVGIRIDAREPVPWLARHAVAGGIVIITEYVS